MSTDNAVVTENDYDSPWKEALERYFPQFMALLFPAVFAEINWAIPHKFLETELQKIVRDAESGRKYMDKLVKVFALNGTETSNSHYELVLNNSLKIKKLFFNLNIQSEFLKLNRFSKKLIF
jgi:hypothetical protein